MNNVITSGPVLPFSTTEEEWFPVRITSVLGPTTYTFQEVWLTDSGLSIADRIGGNSNSSTDPAYAIDGSTFSVTAAGTAVQVLARRAPGLGGAGWELKGFGGSAGAGGFCGFSSVGGYGYNGTNVVYGDVRAMIDTSSILFYDGLTNLKAYKPGTNNYVFNFAGNVAASAGSYYVGIAVYAGNQSTIPPTTNTVYPGVGLTGSSPVAGSVPFDFTTQTRPFIVAPAILIQSGSAAILVQSFSASWS